MNTDELIARLAEGVQPVRPLASPWVRAAVWLLLALSYTAVIVLVVAPRRDLAAKVMDLRFVVEQAAALATSITAAAAAFAMTIPGRNRKAALLPVFPFVAWLGSLSQGPIQSVFTGLHGPPLAPDWPCIPAFALVSLGPAAVMAIMLRRGAPLAPKATMALGGLAAAGIGSFGLRLFHLVDASLMVLVWQFGCVVLLSAIAALTSKRVFSGDRP